MFIENSGSGALKSEHGASRIRALAQMFRTPQPAFPRNSTRRLLRSLGASRPSGGFATLIRWNFPRS